MLFGSVLVFSHFTIAKKMSYTKERKKKWLETVRPVRATGHARMKFTVLLL